MEGNFMKKFKVFLFSFLFLFVSIVNSASYTFVMGDNSRIDTSATRDALFLYGNIDEYLPGSSFTLNEGESERFKLGVIGTHEKKVNRDDRQIRSIEAFLDFDSPELTQSFLANSFGFKKYGFLGIGGSKGWEITWEEVLPIAFGNGGLFSLQLEDLVFDTGLGFWNRIDKELPLYAKLTLDKAPVVSELGLFADPVPEPSTMVLFGLGLLGFGMVVRKKFSK